MSDTPLMDAIYDSIGEEGKSCVNCRKRPATVKWVGTGGALALIHGMYSWWCDVCAVEAQLAYAKEQRRSIRKLERELAVLKAAEETPDA